MTIKQRVLTAAVALPLLILLVLKGSFVLFSCFILVIALLGLDEFYRMALPERKIEGKVAALGGALMLLVFLSRNQGYILFVLTTLVLLSFIIFLFRIRDIRQSAGEAAMFLMGILYVPVLLGHLVLLRGLPHGHHWILLLLVIVMAGDSGAYFIGRSYGKRKLYPIVSPNKSMEGAIGGVVGSILGAVIARSTFFPELTGADAVSTALLLGITGQIGDLFESMLKRSYGVKDSGVIVPGHGGILDRLDSILFAAPAAYYYAVFIFMQR
ncbi:MAG TPA: phosphatidate cytidylyltransferase [Geobacteraceae bacterium]|nr:phosphatidate cytidylyltransferase [Geobacteraceae bacterium]